MNHRDVDGRSLDDHWILIQLNTFTNWVQDQLSNHEATVNDLRMDLCDGTRLCALMEMLQHRRISHVVKKPINQHQCLDNINLALKAMTNDGIKLVNIGAEDIHSGNLKLILGMVWCLILRYQIGRGKTPPKKLMLAWINAVVPGYNVNNFNTDWNDGIALHGLVEYCRPGTFPKWNQLSRRDGLHNCQNGMESAKTHFHIPMVLKPDNLSSPDLDELSGMTYLSYFMRINSPGYNATLKWVQKQIPHMNIKNFQGDWNDGKVLVALVESLGGVIIGGVEHGQAVDILQRAMNAAKNLGVEPVISAKEMSDADVDHLGVMAYAARLQAIVPMKTLQPPANHHHLISSATQMKTTSIIQPSASSDERERLHPSERLKIFATNKETNMNRKYSFSIESDEKEFDKSKVRVVVSGSSTQPPVTFNWEGQIGIYEFIPTEAGQFKIVVYNEEEIVNGCPLLINVQNNISQIRIVPPASSSQFGRPVTFQVNTGQKGSVQAHGRGPSGKTITIEIIEKGGGLYMANFNPSEPGDWMISVLYEGQAIQGCPYLVRVFDPNQVRISGIEKLIAKKPTSFCVETTGAGNGQLSVDVSYNGRPIKAQILAENPKRYRINFSPDGVGTYIIRIYYEGIEIQGSPITMEVVDASNVIASGDGLNSVEINQKTTFFLNLGLNGSSSDVKVHISSPRGNSVPANVIDNRNGNVVIEYTPNEVGDHQIEVFYCGKPIKGNPFHSNVFDWTKIKILNLPNKGSIGQLVQFEIDASESGSGDLEITVNDGSVPCNIRKQDGRHFHSSFLPMEAFPHTVRMKFNGKDVLGSPWKVDVRTPANIAVNSGGIQFVPLGRLAEFEIRVDDGPIDGDLALNVTSPSHQTLNANVINMRNGLYRIEFMPKEVGNHVVEVMYEGSSVPGTPFLCKVYNTSAIAITPVTGGVVGRPVEFSIDVSQAGEGQLEIVVNKGNVQNTVQMMSKGIYLVSFTPHDTRPHDIDIRFNGESIPQGAIVIPIMEASGRTVIARGEGLHQVAANRQSSFQVHAHSTNDSDLIVRVTSPGGHLVPAKMVRQPDGDFKVEYSSKFTGRHTVEILHKNEAIMGSPFYVEIYDPNKIRVEGGKNGMVGHRIEFDVICHEAGKAKLKININGPKGNSVPFEVVPVTMGEHVMYTPREPGFYEIFLTYGGLQVPGCPIRQEISDTSLTMAGGEGLSNGIEDQMSTFYVDSRGQRGDLQVKVDGPNSISKCNIETDIGRFTVSYVPVEVGVFNVSVRWNGREIEGSPFHPRIVNPKKIQPIGGWEVILNGQSNHIQLQPNEVKTIEFDTRQAGPGQLSGMITGPGGAKIPLDIQTKDRGKVIVTFVAQAEGEYLIKLMWNGLELEQFPIVAICGQKKNIRSSPLLLHPLGNQFNISMHGHASAVNNNQLPINLDKVILTGIGLQQARVNQTAEFFIDGTHAGPGKPSVTLSGMRSDLFVQCSSIGDNKYKCTYLAQTPGAYLLYISWSDRQVSGSPYKVTILPASDASKIICSGEGLHSGIMGKDLKANIDVRRAGPGEPMASCMGPTKAAHCLFIDHYDGTFTLIIRPQEPGKHVLQIKYSGQNVQGSPFVINVIGASDASKVQVGGPGILDGVLAVYQSHFSVDTLGAGPGELTVKIRGPRGGFRVEMQRQSQKDRNILCRYDPTEPGEYLIDVRWSGDSVPGSPFVVHIFDTYDELRHYLDDVHHHQAIPHNSAATWNNDFD